MLYRKCLAAAIALTTIGAPAYAKMLSGNIVTDQGEVWPFEIEVARRKGKVTAQNPKSGEVFSGTYVGILQQQINRSSGFFNMNGPDGSINGSGFGNSRSTNSIAYAQAILQGNKGTTLTCDLQIEIGTVFRQPNGVGECTDNKKRKYRLQF